MGSRLAIRRLRLAVLAPHDHPAPRALESRLADAARTGLAPALETGLAPLGGGIMRVRRLAVDITLDATGDDAGFVALLAGAIGAAVRRVTGAAGDAVADADEVVVFPDEAGCVAALVEALASGRSGGCWWQRDADGLRVLPPAMAVRTALLADPAVGEAALLRLPPVRLASVLAVLGGREADRVMAGFAAAAAVALSAEAAAAVVAEFVAAGLAAGVPAAVLPLALYLRAVAVAGGGGPALVRAVRLAAALADAAALLEAGPLLAVGSVSEAARASAASAVPGSAALAEAAGMREAIRAAMGLGGEAARRALAERLGVPEALLSIVAETGALPDAARRALAERRTERVAGGFGDGPQASRFAGLLLLVPGLEFDGIAAQVAAWAKADADTAALIGFAALGLCAGRRNFAAWLHEPAWRALFGLDPAIAAVTLVERLGAIPQSVWDNLAAFGSPPATQREARFLLPRRPVSGGWDRPVGRGLAGLANGIAARFAARLIGLRTASAPFLWDNLLGAGGVFERGAEGWEARLNRPKLDVLVSLSRLAEASVRLPCAIVRLSRAAA